MKQEKRVIAVFYYLATFYSSKDWKKLVEDGYTNLLNDIEQRKYAFENSLALEASQIVETLIMLGH